tara:strand:- start:9804 stop:10010 length:207 start_codon:yes stop_codon:yes gene_type:complete
MLRPANRAPLQPTNTLKIEGIMDMTAPATRCLLALALTALLVGCAGNHKFDDDEYRPLGDPKTVSRDA